MPFKIDRSDRRTIWRDGANAYALFLLRPAESDAVIAEQVDVEIEECVRRFVGSPEFEDKFLRPAALGRNMPDQILEICPKELRDWAAGIFGDACRMERTFAGVLGQALLTIAGDAFFQRPPQPFLYTARVLLRVSLEGVQHRARTLRIVRDQLADSLILSHDRAQAEEAHATLLLVDFAEGLQMRDDATQALVDRELPAALMKDLGIGNDFQDRKIEADMIGRSLLFDAEWYLQRYPEVAETGLSPLHHFLVNGARGHDPSPFFSSRWYLDKWNDVRQAGTNPLGHYLRHGHREGRAPHPAFDSDWYRRRHLAKDYGIEPLDHYIRKGERQGLRPFPLFDRNYYLSRYKDLVDAALPPYLHWLKHGRAEGRLGIDTAQAIDGLKIAVVAHVFYEDLWPEIAARLRAVPIPFDLIVTVSAGSDLATQIRAEWPGSEVVAVSNRGRDIAPFLRVLPQLIAKEYDAVCKIHTKRGATEPDTWRHLMLEGVLGSSSLIRQILIWFGNDPDLAVVGPDALYLNGPRFIGPNAATLEKLFRRAEGPDAMMPDQWGFFAGSMFWIRPRLLGGLLDPGLLEMFDKENSSRDGQVAHAIERLFGLITARDGRRVGLTDVSDVRAGEDVDVRRSPHRMVWDDLADTLPDRTRQLASRIPSLRRSKRRTWLAPPDACPGITFVGPVEAVNGLGVSARGFVEAAVATGLPVHVVKWRPGFERVRMQDYEAPTPGEQAINLIHLNLDLIHSAQLLDQTPFDRLMTADRYSIAIISWELLAVDPNWIDTIHRFDEIWAASSFMVRAIQAVSAIPARLVRPALQTAAHPENSRLPFNLPTDRTIFFYGADFGSIMKRKNPEAFWRAYAAEFTSEDGAFCLVKLHYSDADHPLLLELEKLARSRPDILLVRDSLTDDQMHTLFKRIDAYVSSHRAEGLGLTLLEAMLAGKVVIATGYSGESDFVRNDTALLLDYDLVEVGEGAEPYMAGAIWAEPRMASLRARMRQVVEDRNGAAALAEQGRLRATELFSLTAARDGLLGEIKRIWRNGGGASFDSKLAIGR